MTRFSLQARNRRAFTLVELLVATVVLIIILLMLVAMVNQTATIWRTSAIKVEQFRSARTAFESVNRHLSQATLNTYFDYERNSSNQITKYTRQSDLRFIVGRAKEIVPDSGGDRPATAGPGHAVFFHAPLGYVSTDAPTIDPNSVTQTNPQGASLYAQMDNLLNTWGYYIEFGSDYNYRPTFLNGGGFNAPPERYRYRLMEFMLPSDQMTTYRYTASNNNTTYYARDWFDAFLKLPATPTPASSDTRTTQTRPVHLLAENIVDFIVFPQLSPKDQQSVTNAGGPLLAPGYAYNTSSSAAASGPRTDQHAQLPPVVQVTMIAIDEASATRLAAQQSQSDSTQPPQNLDNMLAGHFLTSSVNDPQTGNSAMQYSRDLTDVQNELVKQKLAFRVFTTSISLKAAKWSQD